MDDNPPRSAEVAKVLQLFPRHRVNYYPPDEATCAARVNAFGGKLAVLQHVALGHTPSDVALQLEVPQMWFDDWVSANASNEELDRAYKIGADNLMAKAQMVLQVEVTSAAEVAQAKALASEYRNMAEKLNAERWGPKRPDGLSGASVSINLNLAESSSQPRGDAAVDVTPPTPHPGATAAADRVDYTLDVAQFIPAKTSRPKPRINVPDISVPTAPEDPF